LLLVEEVVVDLVEIEVAVVAVVEDLEEIEVVVVVLEVVVVLLVELQEVVGHPEVVVEEPEEEPQKLWLNRIDTREFLSLEEKKTFW
jgi:hypothetical protein